MRTTFTHAPWETIHFGCESLQGGAFPTPACSAALQGSRQLVPHSKPKSLWHAAPSGTNSWAARARPRFRFSRTGIPAGPFLFPWSYRPLGPNLLRSIWRQVPRGTVPISRTKAVPTASCVILCANYTVDAKAQRTCFLHERALG